ncbi:MAG TPA: GyrI-like domain-containing protein, partial [Tepidisphaeraceae bacterium]|nr:GyrI-like domain-containing protein [Tepidisphaeraceae bacterium]
MSDSSKNSGTNASTLSPPRIVDRGPIQFVGIRGRYTGQTAPAGIPALWQRFAQDIGNIPDQVPHVAYGLSFMGGKEFEYLAGVEVTKASDFPEGFSLV